MKAANIEYIVQTKKNIEWNIANCEELRPRIRMDQALHYINGALKAVEIGKDESAWANLDKALYWMQQSRSVA